MENTFQEVVKSLTEGHKVNHCSDADIAERFRISKVFGVSIIDYDGAAVLLECTQTENRNDDLIALLKKSLQTGWRL